MTRRTARSLTLAVALTLVAVGGPLAGGASAAAPPLKHYCSPDGQWCTDVVGSKANEILLKLATFNAAGHTLCVNPPRGKTNCRKLNLVKGSTALYHADVRWASKFPRRGRGLYRVTWKLATGERLGPALGFKIP
jgi:hypothetical protein